MRLTPHSALTLVYCYFIQSLSKGVKREPYQTLFSNNDTALL